MPVPINNCCERYQYVLHEIVTIITLMIPIHSNQTQGRNIHPLRYFHLLSTVSSAAILLAPLFQTGLYVILPFLDTTRAGFPLGGFPAWQQWKKNSEFFFVILSVFVYFSKCHFKLSLSRGFGECEFIKQHCNYWNIITNYTILVSNPPKSWFINGPSWLLISFSSFFKIIISIQ